MKYRVIKLNNEFFAQERKWFRWKYICTKSFSDKYSAMDFIDKHFKDNYIDKNGEVVAIKEL